QAGEGYPFMARGLESVSRTGGRGFKRDDMHPRFVDESRSDFVNHMYIPMGLTAENVAEQFDVSRERMDEYAALSQNRAVEAQKNGFFEREITPVDLPDGTIMTQDDGPRPGTTVEKLATLQPAFQPDGKVTAGNA